MFPASSSPSPAPHLTHRVLGAPIDEGHLLVDAGHAVDGRRSDLGLVALERGKQVLLGVVQARDDVTEALRVGGPQDDDLVDLGLLLEGPVGRWLEFVCW